MQLIIKALMFIFPAYCANALPVIMGGGLPLDFGKSFFDGKPIFGRNKTFKGFFSGLAVGTFVGFAEKAFINYPKDVHGFQFGLLLSLGALLGDLIGAFIKRRLGLAPGELLPVVDQIDFIVGALFLALPLGIVSFQLAVVVLIITPPIHLLTNFVAYKLGLKNNPW
ncbi:MAG: CDP-2,3-bis-(O-geranylgeranyl)-sn-glycerol synthase [Candidatus Bathycorpusculaceae bacterium]